MAESSIWRMNFFGNWTQTSELIWLEIIGMVMIFMSVAVMPVARGRKFLGAMIDVCPNHVENSDDQNAELDDLFGSYEFKNKVKK